MVVADNRHMIEAAATGTVTYWLPLITAVIGFASGGCTEWLRDRRAYERERDTRESALQEQRRERRNEFQRKTLLELQDAAMRLMQATHKTHHFDVMMFRKHGEMYAEPHPENISNEEQAANAITAVLGVRVRDRAIRELLQKMKDELTGATLYANSEEHSQLGMRQAGKQFVELNKRIGEVLRSIEDEE
jgi:hypothetical protein